MRTLIWSELSQTQRQEALQRPAAITGRDVSEAVAAIMADVKVRGDQAVSEYTQRFDGVAVDLAVPMASLKSAWDALPASDKSAMENAKANIERFHSAQMPATIEIETQPGVMCRRETRAIETAGLYVPGGTAPLISTLLMLAVPAKVAGVKNRVVVTPPGKDGSINTAVLAAAYLCGVTAVFACGGAQAIAALTYGTETITRCDKLFGPGNAYVAAAKAQAAQEPGGPAIDLPAGPSEAMVLADSQANAAFVASDLLSQAEHDTLAQVVCVCSDLAKAQEIGAAIDSQIASLPRKDIAQEALRHARMIIAENREDSLAIINTYAPEHLIIQAENPESYVSDIQNAGSIFLGPWTPESVGDYASGTNHTLPTFGAARAHSGVTLESFVKYISVQSLTRAGLETLGPTVQRLATLEGLEAHRRAVSLRLKAPSP